MLLHTSHRLRVRRDGTGLLTVTRSTLRWLGPRWKPKRLGLHVPYLIAFCGIWPSNLQPTHQSMILSALISNDCGIFSPKILAVLLLMTSSNLVGCSTGRSDGLAPLSIRSTK